MSVDPEDVRGAKPGRVRETINEPNNDLTEWANEFVQAFEADPRYHDRMRMLVFIDDMEEGRGGAGTSKFESDEELCQNVFRTAQAVLSQYGVRLEITG